MKLKGTNDQLMAMAAHRYCMGRSSYIVSSCQEWIRATWTEFQPNTQSVMVRDTLQELARWMTPGFHDAERHGWQETAQWMWSQLTEVQRQWVTQAVGHIDGAIQFVLKDGGAHG